MQQISTTEQSMSPGEEVYYVVYIKQVVFCKLLFFCNFGRRMYEKSIMYILELPQFYKNAYFSPKYTEKYFPPFPIQLV